MALRSDCGSCCQRVSRLIVPARVSGATKPALADSISRQMLTSREMRTGTPQASDSATAMPKFSWCEGSAKTSAAASALHFMESRSMPVQTMRSAMPNVCGARDERLLPVESIWSGKDQPPSGIVRHGGGICFQQKIATLFGVQAAHEEQDSLALKLRMAIEEGDRLRAGRRRCCAQAGDYGMCAIEPEGFRREALLFLAGKQDGARVTQHAVVCPGPVEPLFHMLERKAALEPRVEHPVGEDVIGRCGAA